MNAQQISLFAALLTVAPVVSANQALDEPISAEHEISPVATTMENRHMHPPFRLVDALANPIEQGGAPLDAAATCGQCHDVEFIRRHSSHPARVLNGDCLVCHTLGDPNQPLLDQVDAQGRFAGAMSAPSSKTCGKCHGLVTEREEFLELGSAFLEGKTPGTYGTTLRTGEVFSPQLMSDSLLNLAEKDSRDLPWDIHAARGLACPTCHFAANNPERSSFIHKKVLRHLKADPRALTLGEYLKRPDHRLNTASCIDCHDPLQVHENLLYKERHLSALACQACHVPTVFAPAVRAVDATVVTLEKGPVMEFRGVKPAGSKAPNAWYNEGYQPFLLEEQTPLGSRFAPYNLVARWQWVSGPKAEPVPAKTVERAWFAEDGSYAPELVAVFDSNQNARLDPEELRIDSPQKTAVIQQRLEALGVAAPRIAGTVTAHPVRHGVMEGKRVAADCDACHGERSRFNETVVLSDRAFPGGVAPVAAAKTAALLGNRQIVAEGDRLRVVGNQQAANRYIIGHSKHPWADAIGYLFFVLTALGVTVHAGLRYVSRRRRGVAHPRAKTQRVYMYGMYERVWHWTMATSVLILAVSGLKLHYPQSLGMMSFATATFVHNAMAFVLIANAFLSLFFHLATGEIRHYVPSSEGFVKNVASQVWYYTKGIFIGAAHPLPKTVKSKLNPLQQLTYVGLLNVLFPIQILTGILLWVGGIAPGFLSSVGGISVVAPIHNLTSWLFLSFVVMHIYLTTTGHKLLSNLKAMIDGWDEIELEGETNPDPQGANP